MEILNNGGYLHLLNLAFSSGTEILFGNGSIDIVDLLKRHRWELVWWIVKCMACIDGLWRELAEGYLNYHIFIYILMFINVLSDYSWIWKSSPFSFRKEGVFLNNLVMWRYLGCVVWWWNLVGIKAMDWSRGLSGGQEAAKSATLGCLEWFGGYPVKSSSVYKEDHLYRYQQ